MTSGLSLEGVRDEVGWSDRNEDIASESTSYRVLREDGQLTHPGSSKPRRPGPVPTHTATGPCRAGRGTSRT